MNENLANKIVAPAIVKMKKRVLTAGNVSDPEIVRHTYAVTGDVYELEKLVSNYLDDCGCDYDFDEVEDATDSLLDDGFSRIGNHFFKLTDLENLP